MAIVRTVRLIMDIDMADAIMEKVMYVDVSLAETEEMEVCHRMNDRS